MQGTQASFVKCTHQNSHKLTLIAQKESLHTFNAREKSSCDESSHNAKHKNWDETRFHLVFHPILIFFLASLSWLFCYFINFAQTQGSHFVSYLLYG